MKHSISVKTFSLLISFLLLIGISILFLNFYNNSKNNIESLLRTNIQTNVLNLKHYLGKNLKEDNINEIKSHLDTIRSVNKSIKNIRIYSDNNSLIYTGERVLIQGKQDHCVPIYEISDVDIFKNNCYSFKTKLYKGLNTYYYSTKINLSRAYIDSLLHNYTIELIIEYALIFLFAFIVSWVIFSKIIKRPLEQLRQFAYYESKAPPPFFIKEIESIRYSLKMTFKRLRQEQRELYRLSTRDQLSGLYNKRSLLEKMEWLIAEKSRKKENFAVIFLDLDNFKTLNDSMGHHIGDRVLKEVADLLLSSVRTSDIVSRIGGDEFVIVFSEINLDTSVIELLERIKKNILAPLTLENIKYQITSSMGVAIYPKDGQDVNTLLKNADIAMYKSKENGKNNYHFFTDSFNTDIQKKISMQNLLLSALENNYFKLFYQPKVCIKTNKISSCEALIRLVDPQKGLIPPNDFIPIAEENNFILPLGYWIIEESVRQLKKWENTEFHDIKISINFSVKQFRDIDLIYKLSELTQEIDRKKLDIELTESVFVNGLENHYEIIEQIKRLGFSLSLDDFGTGYSSLSYLKNIPFDTLKIDKAFIDDLENENGKAFVKMIVNIAKTLHMKVVAEGVETELQEKYLESIECELYQGYLCSKPLQASEFELLLKSKNYL